VVLVLAGGGLLDATPAAAAGDSGARSTVVGRGDIVTSILGWVRPGTRPRPAGTAPRCAWRTLTDAQLEWLVSVAAQAVGLGLRTPLLDPLRPYLDGADLPDGDLQGYVCGVDTYELRFVERTEPRSAQELLYRQMITRLPVPEPVITPRPDAVVPVGQPVFVSIAQDRWRPISGELTWQGITARVEATPTALRVITGDPSSATTSCNGPGRPFRAGQVSAAEQARHPEACTVVYRSATEAHRSPRSVDRPGRPDLWLGTVTVVWTARWRVGDGAWQELGAIPRTRLIARAARELTTSIEHTPD
jgi:hypothetical protein